MTLINLHRGSQVAIEAKEETSLKLNIPAAFGGSALGWTGDFESPSWCL
jgi:hypothetical protein